MLEALLEVSLKVSLIFSLLHFFDFHRRHSIGHSTAALESKKKDQRLRVECLLAVSHCKSRQEPRLVIPGYHAYQPVTLVLVS